MEMQYDPQPSNETSLLEMVMRNAAWGTLVSCTSNTPCQVLVPDWPVTLLFDPTTD